MFYWIFQFLSYKAHEKRNFLLLIRKILQKCQAIMSKDDYVSDRVSPFRLSIFPCST